MRIEITGVQSFSAPILLFLFLFLFILRRGELRSGRAKNNEKSRGEGDYRTTHGDAEGLMTLNPE
jgi:hypothetical protein